MRVPLDKGLGRTPYFTAGVTLFAVKIAIDIAVARVFSRPYSLLYYIRPSDAPLFHPAENTVYWLAMWAVALPFIAVGFVLTIRRLRDAGLSAWLALLFFAPFVNIMFFGFCALVPGRETAIRPDGRDPGRPVRMTYARAAIAAGAVGAVVGLAAFGMVVGLLRAYGGGLFIGAPPIGGFVTGILFARWHRPLMAGAILSALLSLFMAGAIVVVFALEGLLCLAMAMPLVLLGAVIGAVVGCLLERHTRGMGMAPSATALLLLPLVLSAEGMTSLPASEFLPVESSILVNAPPDTVWRHVTAFAPLPPPSEWIFSAGVAAPMGAVIDGEGEGAVRRCEFTTGAFIEPIETWDPPRELGFAVTFSPDPMSEWTLWEGPRPPHLDGYLESARGQFLLEALPGGRTRLVGRTWYRTNMVPERYWRLWADPIIHTIHMRVLRHVAGLAEASIRESPSPTGF
ncbi:MAG TPA: DUF805 domain-containing protein [Candidatus Polarisedimenticolia bacterium]|jgi:uncharacterized membrane protein YhaH (DUF805 family)|nr:DUF805 domain-containing protein [Candidatus Polarisedimenticolia bacterium]